jgi:glycosyltransferase involved in cell wall biosynthesis
LDWRKNVAGAVAGFARLPRPLRDGLQFVLAGDVHSHDLEKIQALWAQEGLEEEQLRILGHVDDALLVQLYRHTDLVLQPSFMEGFGLTALEAMHCGAPVIAADAGALPEVVGDARALFDPAQPDAIAARMEEFLSNQTLTRSLIAHGVEQARAFSWQRTAGLAVDALEQVARQGRVARPRDELRRITLEHLDQTLRARDRTAQTLAAAEPPLAMAAG